MNPFQNLAMPLVCLCPGGVTLASLPQGPRITSAKTFEATKETRGAHLNPVLCDG